MDVHGRYTKHTWNVHRTYKDHTWNVHKMDMENKYFFNSVYIMYFQYTTTKDFDVYVIFYED